MTKPAELRDLPDDELLTRLDAAKEELFNLRFQLATGQLDNPMRIKQVRHDISRIITLLRERELGIVIVETPARAERRRLIRRRKAEAEESGGQAEPEESAGDAPGEDES